MASLGKPLLHAADAPKSGNTACNSMSFFAPVNERSSQMRRGLHSNAHPVSEQIALFVATLIVGLFVAFIVNVIHFVSSSFIELKLDTIGSIRRSGSGYVPLLLAFLLEFGSALGFAAIAFVCVLAVPNSRGSGLPQLIAYLNGCKIKKLTSARTAIAKVVGTICALNGGFFVGPEGPIIHLGGCVGKLMLRALYYIGRAAQMLWCGTKASRFLGALTALRNDLDERDFVAIGAGAGVSAAFMAPISGTLFVVEEAASHAYSLSLLWRSFGAAIVALWGSHFLDLGESLISIRGQGSSTATSIRANAHLFHIKFDLGAGSACSFPDNLVPLVLILASLGGLIGALINHAIIAAASFRQRVLLGKDPTLRRRITMGALELSILAFLSSSASVFLPELEPCQPLTVGMLEYGINGTRAGLPPLPSTLPLSASCMPPEIREQVRFGPVNETCDTDCLAGSLTYGVDMLVRSRCAAGEYNGLASLLLAPAESTVKALFLRGAPAALSPSALSIALVAWLLMLVLTAGAPMALGLMIPLIVVGGCLGRLFGLGIRFFLGFEAEPSLFALVGSTATLAGSGQIRLFLTVVMLEITDQLHLAPFVALAAWASTLTASFVSSEGLYHKLIEHAGLPYLHLDRPPEPAPSPLHVCDWIGCGGAGERTMLVSDVMAQPLVVVRRGQTKAELASVLAAESHNSFPVVVEESNGLHHGSSSSSNNAMPGTLAGLLLRSELRYFGADARVESMMDRAPPTVQAPPLPSERRQPAHAGAPALLEASPPAAESSDDGGDRLSRLSNTSTLGDFHEVE